MALETWLIKVKTAITHKLESSSNKTTAAIKTPRSNGIPRTTSKRNKHSQTLGVLAFEISGLMSKLLHLWQSLSDKNIAQLRTGSISLEGVRKIVSNDESFLLGLACAEMIENLCHVARSVSRLGHRCDDAGLRRFGRLFEEFADSGRDPHGWALKCKEVEARVNGKMDKYVSLTSLLHKEMEELVSLETALRKSLPNDRSSSKDQQRVIELQQKVVVQRQEVKCLKEKSLWNRSYDTVVSLLVRSIFTVLTRIKLVFEPGPHGSVHFYPSYLPRSLSASASVHPTDQNPNSGFVSGPLKTTPSKVGQGFLEAHSKLLKPPETTLGASGLGLHYANLIIVMEKMIRSPQLVGIDARDDLYSMLPTSVRSSLRARLKGVGFTATDPRLAGEWKEALERILGWLSPLAHNMIKWQSERSFEQQQGINLVGNNNKGGLIGNNGNSVLLLQTLFFANKDKAEAAITELLVGLNYIWRFEREMTAKALFDCANFNVILNNSQSCR